MNLRSVLNGLGKPVMIRKQVIILVMVLLFFASITTVVSALQNGTETPITTNPTCNYESSPALFGDKIIWEDVRDPSLSQIYIYNLTTGEEYPVNASQNFQFQPAIYGNTVVWVEPDFFGGGNDSKIVQYDTVSLARNEYHGYYDALNYEYNFPKIFEDLIVWQDYNETNSNWDISVVRNIGSNIQSPTELIVYGDGDQKHPEIYQNYIVYENWTGAAYSSPSDIWLYNLSNNTAVPVSEVFYQETFPHIYGEKIVWEASNLSGDGSHIHVYDRGVVTRLTPMSVTPFDQFHPAIYGNYVVVEDQRRAALPDVYLYDLLNGTETWVSPNNLSGSQLNPDVYDKRIVWADTRAGTGNMDVYLFTLGPAVECPLAGFSTTSPVGPAGLSVTFTDASSQRDSILHRAWDFGDGSPVLLNPADPVTRGFASAGIYPVKLTVGNTLCRNTTPDICRYKIYVDSPPEVDFFGSPVNGFTPLTVNFTDASCGSPETWLWDFGDGNTSNAQNPLYTYLTPATAYSVSLTVNNSFGNAATSTKLIPDYIRTLLGSTEESITPVEGITIDQSNQHSFLVVNGSLLTSHTLNTNTSLIISDPPDYYGWQNITFVSSDGTGFNEDANHTITGNFSTVYFHTKNLTVTNTSYKIGMDYQFSDSEYPVQSITTSEIWEGALPADTAQFEYFASLIPPTGFTTISAIPFTAHITKNPIFGEGNATITLSISSSWYDSIQETPTTPVIIIGTGNDSVGNTIGGGLKPARYRAGGIDHFVAEAPVYMTSFGLAQVSGSGNVFQFITLIVTSQISPGSGGSGSSGSRGSYGSGGGGSSKPVVVQKNVSSDAIPDPGKTAKIYANPQGIITQATTLQSTDGLANVSIGLGTVARNSNGNPLTSITITRVPDLTVAPPADGLSIIGIAYELYPDGATFSPAIPLTLTIPGEQRGKEYILYVYDHSTSTWQALPSSYDPQTGKITTEITHLCCITLFAKTSEILIPATLEPIYEVSEETTIIVAPKSSIQTDVEMYTWIFSSIVRSPLILVILLAALVAVAYFGWWKKHL